MNVDMILTLVSAAAAIVGGIGAVSARRLMRAVASLALLFAGLAGLFGLLGAPYLAAAQLFLFVGGVVTLLALAFGSTHTPVAHGTALVTIGVAAVGVLLGVLTFPATQDTGVSVSVQEVAHALFVQYGPALQVALLIILSGVLGIAYLLGERTEAQR